MNIKKASHKIGTFVYGPTYLCSDCKTLHDKVSSDMYSYEAELDSQDKDCSWCLQNQATERMKNRIRKV